MTSKTENHENHSLVEEIDNEVASNATKIEIKDDRKLNKQMLDEVKSIIGQSKTAKQLGVII